MSDGIETVDAKRGITRTEHVLKSVLNGGIESVRSRLIQALEQLGYHVVSADPLEARRAARGLGRYYLSANILEFPTKLTIGLRELGPASTLATLDYVSEHPGGLSFKGDLHTQMREAEAIIAIAASEGTRSACSFCGTAHTSEGRFCRVCGSPTVGREPAELEVLRITAGGRAGHHLIMTGAILLTLGLFATIAVLAVGGFPGPIFAALMCLVGSGLVVLAMGIAGLSKALERDRSVPNLNAATGAAQLDQSQPNRLPAPSVTEATTSLLGRVKERVPAKGLDTSPLDK
jgi:hypothetical protein